VFDEFLFDDDFREQLRIRREFDHGPVAFVRGPVFFPAQFAAVELRFLVFPVTDRPGDECPGQCIDRFGADSVQADRKLKHVGIVFRSGIDLGDACHQFAQRNASTVVTDRDRGVFQRDVDPAAIPHDIFVDAVVDHFLQHHIKSVVLMVAVAHAANIHARPLPDMFQRGECFDLIVCIRPGGGILHRQFIFFDRCV